MNIHGLSRNIPAAVRREVRRRSKFGCVVCRSGITEYEHIDPPFSEARIHDPDCICLLCSACHAKVTRGQLSKETVRNLYIKVSNSSVEEVERPRDTFDFNPTSSLCVGGFLIKTGAPCILKYFGEALIETVPSDKNHPFGLNAKFFDGDGQVSLEIEDNTWFAPAGGGDFYVLGQRLFVKDQDGRECLVLRTEPPDKLVVERLDMRVGRHHILATEKRHAVGFFDSETSLPIWYTCGALPRTIYPGAAVFEIADESQLSLRSARLPKNRKHMETGPVVISEFFGIGSIEHGIVFCTHSGFDFRSFARGRHSLNDARSAVFRRTENMGYLISRGGDPLAYDMAKQEREAPDTLPPVGEGVSLLLDWSAIGHPDLPYPR